MLVAILSPVESTCDVRLGTPVAGLGVPMGPLRLPFLGCLHLALLAYPCRSRDVAAAAAQSRPVFEEGSGGLVPTSPRRDTFESPDAPR